MSFNGWTNYATWRVNLEMLGDIDLADSFEEKPDLTDAIEFCREYVEEVICEQSRDLALGYARAFIADVNFREIATHLLNDSTFPSED
jgi:hypothetical protein